MREQLVGKQRGAWQAGLVERGGQRRLLRPVATEHGQHAPATAEPAVLREQEVAERLGALWPAVVGVQENET